VTPVRGLSPRRRIGVTIAAVAVLALTAPPYAGAQASDDSWPVYHGDQEHTGFVKTGIGPSRVHRVWRSARLDEDIYAEPLLVNGLVIVATEGNTVAAFDATTGKRRWRRNLGTPVNGSDLPCGNIDPTGITSTPVADPDAGVVYVVTFSRRTPAATTPVHLLVGLDLQTGEKLFERGADPPGSDPTVQQFRGALGLLDGHVLVPVGGLFGDCGDYHGYVVGIPATGAKGGDLRVFQVPAGRAAAIWTPSGVSVDPDGNVLVSTGNATETGSGRDLSNSVIRLSPLLEVIDSWTPRNRDQLSLGDIDLGQIAPVVVPGGLVFVVGKDGIGYLMRNDDLGGTGGQVFDDTVCDGGAWGGTARVKARVFVACGEGLAAVDIAGERFSVAWRDDGFLPGPPIVTGGTVWVLDINHGTLRAFDAGTGKSLRTLPVGDLPTHFVTPTAGGGRIYVAADRRVLAFASA
jgi:outer membrane protein assembly factor BamB